MYAKVLLASGAMGCSEEALTIIGMLSAQNIYYRCAPRGRCGAAGRWMRLQSGCCWGVMTGMRLW